MTKAFNLKGLPNSEGETNSNELIKSLKGFTADPSDDPSGEHVCEALKNIIKNKARNLQWPSIGMQEDVIQNVLEELTRKGVHNDTTLGALLKQNAPNEQIIRRLEKMAKLRLSSRRADQLKTKKWQNTILGGDLDTDQAVEAQNSNIPAREDVLNVLRDVEKIPSISKRDREIVTSVLESGERSLPKAAAKIGVSKDKVRRAVLRIRPYLRKDFEMD